VSGWSLQGTGAGGGRRRQTAEDGWCGEYGEGGKCRKYGKSGKSGKYVEYGKYGKHGKHVKHGSMMLTTSAPQQSPVAYARPR
jgi:hypothetical protein